MLKKLYASLLRNPLLSLLIYGVLLRLLVFIFYNAVTIYPDSQNYIDLGKLLLDFNLANYSGERTPGFPALIALAGGNLQLVILFQTCIGLSTIYLIFDFCKIKSNNIPLAFWTTFITTSFMHVLFYEFAILTETLTLFLLTLTFWFIEKYEILKPDAKITHYLILSFILGCLYFTRPMFIYIPIGLFLFIIAKNLRSKFRKTFLKSCILLILPFICFYSWCSLNERNNGYFTSSWYLGINLSQTATSFFDKAPNEDKLIRDIYVKHRDYVATHEAENAYPMSVWYAYDELLEKTQLAPPDLAHELGRISINLFKAHPDLYLKQVVISWSYFWGRSSSLLWNIDKFESSFIRRALVGLWLYVQSYVLILVNILFIIFSIKKLYHFFKSRCTFDSDLFLIAIVFSGSLAQALVVFGSNSRFCFPFLPLIVYFVLINLHTLKNTYAKRAPS